MVSSRYSLKMLSEIQSPTLNTPREKLSLLLTLSMLWKDKARPFTDSVDNPSLHSDFGTKNQPFSGLPNLNECNALLMILILYNTSNFNNRLWWDIFHWKALSHSLWLITHESEFTIQSKIPFDWQKGKTGWNSILTFSNIWKQNKYYNETKTENSIYTSVYSIDLWNLYNYYQNSSK